MSYSDKDDPRNSVDYYTGKKCIEKGCNNPAGTAWSPYWCFQHNAERLDRISQSLEFIQNANTEGEGL